MLDEYEGIKSGVETYTTMEVDIEFWKLLAVSILMSMIGALSRFFVGLVRNKVAFTLLELLASFFAALFGAIMGLAIANHYSLDIYMLALISSFSGTMSLTIIHLIVDNDTKIFNKILNIILRK